MMANEIDRVAAHAALDDVLDALIRADQMDGAETRVLTNLAIRAFCEFVGETVGSYRLRKAIGDPPDEHDRSAVLACLARQLGMVGQLFESMEGCEHRLILDASKEAMNIANGDKPQLFSALRGKIAPVRVALEKKAALEWEAFLEAFGIDRSAYRSALVDAYGTDWDTISRWRTKGLSAIGDFEKDIKAAQQEGMSAASIHFELDKCEWPFQPTPGMGWRAAVASAGQKYRRQASIKINGI